MQRRPLTSTASYLCYGLTGLDVLSNAHALHIVFFHCGMPCLNIGCSRALEMVSADTWRWRTTQSIYTETLTFHAVQLYTKSQQGRASVMLRLPPHQRYDLSPPIQFGGMCLPEEPRVQQTMELAGSFYAVKSGIYIAKPMQQDENST